MWVVLEELFNKSRDNFPEGVDPKKIYPPSFKTIDHSENCQIHKPSPERYPNQILMQ
jgi:hypothetical protein